MVRGTRWLSDAIRLSSDRRRQGQAAFTASPFSRLATTHALSMAGDALVTLALAGTLYPVPPAPYNHLPYYYLVYLAAGLTWFALAARRQ